MASNKVYWKSVAQLDSQDETIQKLEQNEFVSKLPVEDFLGDQETLENSNTSRRDFLKYVGFSTAAATVAACEGPVIKSVPYVVQPEQIRPGNANYYATAIADGFDFANILVKTREGRPIKIENNTDAVTFGTANARVHASVLSLYDTFRIQGPKANGEDVSWEQFNAQVGATLKALAATNKEVVLLTQTFASPTTAKIIDDFRNAFPNVRHIVYDAISSDAALDAFEQRYGMRALADYDFSKADTIVSIDADFLGDWQGGGYDAGYVKGRIPKKGYSNAKMSWHVQLESNMTLSGANADQRIPLTPVAQRQALAHIYGAITNTPVATSLEADLAKKINSIVNRIKKAGSKSVVVSGIEDVNAQAMILAINAQLQSEAFDVNAPRLTRSGNAKVVKELLEDMQSGKVKGLITAGVNPVYTLAEGSAFAEAMKGLEFSLAFSAKEDETASEARFVAATPHYLESWGDYEFKRDHYSLAQPTIRPLFDTRQFQDVMLQLLGSSSNYHETIKAHWNASVLEGNSWNQALHDGIYSQERATSEAIANEVDIDWRALTASQANEMSLVLYSKTGMGDGQQANNPWLQEFPDPITRVSWDNYLTMSASDAKAFGFKNENVANGGLNGSYATITVNESSIKVPVLIQPGQAKGTVGLAFGYGKKKSMQEEMQVGVNAFSLYNDFNNVQNVTITAASGMHKFACVQLHNTLMGRGDIVKETTLEIFNTKDKKHWNAIPVVSKNHVEVPVTDPGVDMWQEFDRSVGHHFNLSIDLNACTGCGACVIACHSENNVPVVGKQEIRRSRDMHWLRIDRYYSSEDTFEVDEEKKDLSEEGAIDTLRQMEEAAENPQVAFQPVMCQHCNHAPCETVCPVAATSHGRQGQNHMAYNRCVGTRYCANNCPYKVRRFNWFLYSQNDEFDYHMNNDLGRMVLNPDVVVRSRGVMEKCSMCIQMTQKTILDAKLEGRPIQDGEFQTACSKACGTGAIVFGDINDKESKITELKENERMYHLLESVGTKPNVMYQLKVRNTEA